MSSINTHYTFQYSQPEEYHFSHDSVFLARQVFELLSNEDLSAFRGLDLCAGCGIVGMDFLFHYSQYTHKKPRSFDFIEIQSIYQEHFLKNSQQISSMNIPLHFKNISYSELNLPSFAQQYDLILCNPPYFQMGQGKMSPSAFKNRCRVFIDSDFRQLILGIENSLALKGRAFILFRDLQDHKMNYFDEAEKILSKNMNLEKIGEIRGTDLICITKLP